MNDTADLIGTTVVDASDAGSRTAPDAACAAAVELARAAAIEVGGDTVGDHLGCERQGERAGGNVVEHSFACAHAGYVGWRWSVVVARAPRSKVVTVDEVVLLPAAEAILAPAWLPWAERIRPGDLGPGDLVTTAVDDPRLVPSYAVPLGVGEEAAPAGSVDDEDDILDATALEQAAPDVAAALGLGRVRVLSLAGRDDAADRWYGGENGPESALAQQAPDHCGTCGFYLPLAGALGRVFGACANAMAPDDGHIVSHDHGCGAHSEGVDLPPLPQVEAPPPLLDEFTVDYDAEPAS